MSLVRIALRIAGVQALRGNTDVGANVLDSQIGAIDIGADNRIRTDQKKPFLALYTDTAKSGANAGSGDAFDLGARVLTLNGVTDIVIEAGVTAAMTTIDPDTDTEILSGIGVPAIDRNLEAQLDIIIRQVCTALNDPDNEWADIFRGLTHRYVRIERLRAATPEGQRIAAHQLRITASLIDDPLPGGRVGPRRRVRAISVQGRLRGGRPRSRSHRRQVCDADRGHGRRLGSPAAVAWFHPGRIARARPRSVTGRRRTRNAGI